MINTVFEDISVKVTVRDVLTITFRTLKSKVGDLLYFTKKIAIAFIERGKF